MTALLEDKSTKLLRIVGNYVTMTPRVISGDLNFQTRNTIFFPPLWRCGPKQAMVSSFLRFLDHTQRRTTVGRSPLDE